MENWNYFYIINILLSTWIYSIDDIRNPSGGGGYGDLKALTFPNVLLGFPTLLLMDSIDKYIALPLAGQRGTIYNADVKKEYHINLFIHLFILLTIYWFLIGAFIGFIYGKIKQK